MARAEPVLTSNRKADGRAYAWRRKPVSVDEPLDLGPDPGDRFDARCLWWRHELLHRRALTHPETLLALITPSTDYSLVKGADIVVEAVFENVELPLTYRDMPASERKAMAERTR